MNDFYIDRLPFDCEYQAPPSFFFEGNPLGRGLQVVDDRWTAEDMRRILSAPLPVGYADFFEVTDIESNVDGSENWVCGFSLYFMKRTYYEGQEHRESPATHNKLVDGVELLVDYHERSPETTLRFYCSPEAWEVVHKRGLMGGEHTQFYKMFHASEDSQIGTMWRLLALDDKDYEYAIQTDVAPDEPWITARITDWGQKEFLDRLGDYYLSGETYFDEFSEYQKEFHPTMEDIKAQIQGGLPYPWIDIMRVIDHITCGGITTRPAMIPSLVPLFCEYLKQDRNVLTLFNCETRRWTRFEQDDSLYWGWKGLGPDQNFWRFLKKVIPVRHIVDSWADRLKDYPEGHYVFRMIRQYEKEGHQFLIDKTWERVLDSVDRNHG